MHWSENQKLKLFQTSSSPGFDSMTDQNIVSGAALTLTCTFYGEAGAITWANFAGTAITSSKDRYTVTDVA